MAFLTIKQADRTYFRIMEDPVMPAIVEFPTIVQEALVEFSDLFANQPERVHFAEYLTGLMVAHKKNVSAINREFAVTTDQSCLNRWLTEVGWDEQELNRRRLDWLQKDPSTRYCAQGVIALDNVLIDHDGKLIEDVGYFWDHAEQRHKIAHDYLIGNYVCPSGKHYPIDFHRFVKRDRCEAQGVAFRDHNDLFRELVDRFVEAEIPGDFTFDSWFTNAGNLNHLHAQGRTYVGDLKFNRKVLFRGQTLKAEQVAAQIPPADRKAVVIHDTKQWYFTKSIRIPEVDHPVRMVILWKHWNSSEASKILVTNKTQWEVMRIVRVYRNRWPGTECFHRDGKQHLGMGDCQLRDGRGADPPPLSGIPGVQRFDASTAAGPCACVGTRTSDDHRTSLHGCVARNAQPYDRLGHRAGEGGRLE
jgi:hypothetical protein